MPNGALEDLLEALTKAKFKVKRDNSGGYRVTPAEQDLYFLEGLSSKIEVKTSLDIGFEVDLPTDVQSFVDSPAILPAPGSRDNPVEIVFKQVSGSNSGPEEVFDVMIVVTSEAGVGKLEVGFRAEAASDPRVNPR